MEPRVIAGRYQLFERLGKGAMGVVYRAYDPVLDRNVAAKMMAADVGDDAPLRERFLKEARAAARLNHRHIVTIHELAEVDDEICIIMELLDGVDLTALISRPTPLPLAAKLTIIDQVLDGLHFAHEQGVVHRDIKPGNLHLTSAGVAKILDFGIARLLTGQMTGTRGVFGTPAYMSPEQALGQQIDRRTDLFAVGAVLYELLRGARPFQADSVPRVMALIVEAPHEPLGPEVPEVLSRLVDRLLSKDPAGRPETAAAARAELGRAMGTVAAATDTGHDARGDISEAVRETITARGTIALEPASPPVPRPMVPVDHRRPSNASGLTAFALQQGRTLRQKGDLGGAMRALRSVLEADPGNKEALSDLQRVEQELSGSEGESGVGTTLLRRYGAVVAVALLVGGAGLAAWWAVGSGGGTDDELDRQAAAVSPASVATAPTRTDGAGLDLSMRAPVDQSAGVPADTLGTRRPASEGPPPPPAAEPPGGISNRDGPGRGRLPPGGRGGPPAFGRGRAGVQGGAANAARERFDQLRRVAERQGLDDAAASELASIRNAAETASAAGNDDEAGEIYFRGLLLLEEMLPTPTDEAMPRRDARRDAGRAADDAGIRRVIDEYVSGIGRRDVTAVRRIRPTLSSFEQRLLDAVEPARVRFEGLQIQAGPENGTVTALRIIERTDVQPRRREDRVEMSLSRTAEGWQITDLRSALRPR
jgi:tRNA A-37 threonylcarbamoyl transferase component Bud32